MKAWLRYEYHGRMLTLRELAERTGIPEPTLRRRLALGWSVRRATTTPVAKHQRD